MGCLLNLVLCMLAITWAQSVGFQLYDGRAAAFASHSLQGHRNKRIKHPNKSRETVLRNKNCADKSGFIVYASRKEDASSLYEEDSQATSYLGRRRIRPKRPSSSVTKKEAAERLRGATAQKIKAEALSDPTLLSQMKFSAVQELDPRLRRALTQQMGLDQMTDIQSKTYGPILQGRNVVGQARTGTGKTLAFLVPIVQRLLIERNEDTTAASSYLSKRNIGALIVAPTRELAQQIASQAEQLLTFIDTTVMSVVCCYGGTKMVRDVNLLQKQQLPTLLVATPGRLKDHLSQTTLRGKGKFSDIVKETSIVVLDETDRLLDMGFRKDIQLLLKSVARPEKRQLLLFSATIPKSMQLQTIMSKQPYHHVDCCRNEKTTDATKIALEEHRLDINVRVEQSHVVLPNMSRYVCALVEILLLYLGPAKNNAKIVVFLPTARTVSFFYQIFVEMTSLDASFSSVSVYEMHSRKTQSARNKASSDFRICQKGGVLFTTNVSARGVDYPDVTHVIQYGAPDSKENYIHRLGRTARAGRAGKGLLVLLPFETSFLKSKGRGRHHDLAIPENDEISHLLNQPVSLEVLDTMLEPIHRRIASGDPKLMIGAQGAYRAFLAYYMEQRDQFDLEPEDIVEHANAFSKCAGLTKVPQVSEKIVSRLKLKGIPGLVVSEDEA